ncbi:MULTISPECIES: PCMD domain-containing protein [unclassified Bacteroides]|uniref:PCMD domain-containing protein n=1 Tax=unclassified Bacteroides TaxID=2646097 RepID=UPI001F28D169|nr:MULTISPECIES: PCMD domain-containing protein [unclassified Bacteroides]
MLFLGSMFVFMQAQERVVPIPFGDMNNWVTRKIHESGIIGGATKSVYAVGPTQTIEKNEAYENLGGSPWATSNVFAKVAGISKTNVSVFPEKRGDGYCARLETRYESVKVFGLVDIEVIAAGSLFTGSVHEPISGTKNPMRMLNMGIPFTEKPKALRFDYKIKMSGESDRVCSTGFSKKTKVKGTDYPVVVLLLQKRWEDGKGNIYAIRVGTMVLRYDKSTDWVNGATYPIHYGNITKEPFYVEEWMKIQDQERYSTNSKGKSVPVKEMGWGTANDMPTHMVLQFASSHGGAYIGSPGNAMWVDNVALVY